LTEQRFSFGNRLFLQNETCIRKKTSQRVSKPPVKKLVQIQYTEFLSASIYDTVRRRSAQTFVLVVNHGNEGVNRFLPSFIYLSNHPQNSHAARICCGTSPRMFFTQLLLSGPSGGSFASHTGVRGKELVAGVVKEGKEP